MVVGGPLRGGGGGLDGTDKGANVLAYGRTHKNKLTDKQAQAPTDLRAHRNAIRNANHG